ncbi:Sds3-like-domain-containing protein [Dendryphion nanum]|uniref:Sds3-like-domain-containing protein n=1 Tax=Dendryphion nanum TaxID=256645 RepID=A0A9P9IKE2_9PLEO|nr:Sds3-like-domain-containing protein [Dendryphion nanum]
MASTPPVATTTTIQVPNSKSPLITAAEVLSSLPAALIVPTIAPVVDKTSNAKDIFDDTHADDRSSSLSELGDASDEQSEPTPRASRTVDMIDNDSEAETERLEETPRKLARTGTNASLASELMYERTPSKLAHSRTIEQESSPPRSPTPSDIIEDADTLTTAVPSDRNLHSLSLLAASEAASLELAGKKRKRSSAGSSSVDEAIEEPARKRSSTVPQDTTVQSNRQGSPNNSVQVDIEEELDIAEERIAELAQEEIELEERQADVAVEAISELATVSKLTKPRKGGRRGKRKIDDTGGVNETFANADAPEAEGDAEHDEDDGAAPDEEVVKKRSAIDELAKIERKFKIFREKLCDEQISQCEQELELLKQPNCQHPEYLAMIQAVDDRRAAKIDYEKQLMQYKQQCLKTTTTAERHQLHSQYLQTVRDVRETVLSECNQRIYELQRGRRQLGVEEIEYAIRLPEKRSEQIRQQAAYNLEVSILSGIAKHVGFPAAPDLRTARPAEVEDDFRAMKIAIRPTPQPVPSVRQYHHHATADEAAAEEQFIERTPWANPHHPMHQQSHYHTASAGPSRTNGQNYQTPAGQRRMVDIHAPSGSASTIEINSNPPSSNVAQQASRNGRVGESESPVLQMKRHPSDHLPYAETPAFNARNMGGMPKEPYASNMHVLSSPAAPHTEPHNDDSTRWVGNGVRPLNSGTPSVPGSRQPMTQRGPVVQPLFGR